MTRQQDIEKRVRKFLADQERNRFTRPMEAAFMAFLDLALECGEFDDFKSLVVSIPKTILGWDTSLYLTDETSMGVLEASTDPALNRRLEEGERVALPLHDEAVQTGDEYRVPLRYRGNTQAANGENQMRPEVGLLSLAPGNGLDETEIFFIDKYADLIALSIAQRLLSRKNRQHINFIKNLVADIGHNVIVPNIFFKAYLRRLSGKIDRLGEILRQARDLSHALPQTLPTGVRDLSADLANTTEGILEEFDHIEKHYVNTSLFLETLLRQSHFEKGQYVLQKKNCNFRRDIIGPQMDRFLPRLREKGIEVDLSMGGVPDEVFEAVVDVGLISQVFANLLSNAVKYTRPVTWAGGERRKIIAYGLERVPNAFDRQADGVKLNLFSTGPSLNSREVDNIFSEGYRGSNVERERGTGHGLYFVKEVIELHGGRSGCESKELGNNFFFILPV